MQQVLPVADGCVSWRVSSLPALFVQGLSVQLSYFYDAFAHNYYVQILLRGMQCGATALILDVGINLLQKELKKKLLLPVNRHCGHTVVGVRDLSLSQLADELVEHLRALCAGCPVTL